MIRNLAGELERRREFGRTDVRFFILILYNVRLHYGHTYTHTPHIYIYRPVSLKRNHTLHT